MSKFYRKIGIISQLKFGEKLFLNFRLLLKKAITMLNKLLNNKILSLLGLFLLLSIPVLAEERPSTSHILLMIIGFIIGFIILIVVITALSHIIAPISFIIMIIALWTEHLEIGWYAGMIFVGSTILYGIRSAIKDDNNRSDGGCDGGCGGCGGCGE